MNEKNLRDLLRKKNMTPENMTADQKAQFDQLKDKMGQYKEKDVSELIQEIDRLKLNRDVREKLKGKDMDVFTNNLKPMLTT
jgi:hypothetical protein